MMNNPEGQMREKGSLEQIKDQLAKESARAGVTAENVERLSDHILGGTPTADPPDASVVKGHEGEALCDALGYHIDRLGVALDRIDRAQGRLRDSVGDS